MKIPVKLSKHKLKCHMDNNELYDSLEEEATAKPQDVDLSKSVPLYDGEKPLEAVKSKRLSSKIPVKRPESKKPNKSDRKEPKNRSRCGTKTSVNLLDFREKNSYVNLFYAKSRKLKKEKPPNDTTRSQIGDFTERGELSDVSDATEFSDARSSCSDTTSFYFDVIKKMESGQDLEEEKKPKRIVSPATTAELNLRSVSEFSVVSATARATPKSKINPSLPIPKLGGLGPDLVKTQEKLSRLQKQKSYGQKASDQNRIKILELKVLRELKEEIRNSKS